MNSTYSELLKQRSELDQKIEEARMQELDAALKQIRDLMDQYGITAQEILPTGARGPVRRERAKVEPKYRDPATGTTWSGRGKPPAWIAGKDREPFAIANKA
ncbi:MAG: H-NS histone family protein [Rhodoferax sp.]|jgi:DNA-binding protein H-NS|uniref:H-NS histone family protein n=1 Tax=Acidovorax sp. LjRoot74 TaxID=3342337 RepID=UPI0018097096|nr:H-NS histone family protein [Sideroxydans sp.]MCF8154802.1 H-NS histone family protein [Rhodoferax sp.]